MNTEKIRELAMKAAEMFPCNIKESVEEINKLEKTLGVTISEELKESYVIYAYDLFRSFEFMSFPEGVIQETLRLRQSTNLPLDTLLLSEDESSLVLMKCLADHEEVYWIDFEDYESYCRNKPFIYNPTIFSTFADFFAYLLDEEEKKVR